MAIEQYFWRNLTLILKPQMPIIDHNCNKIVKYYPNRNTRDSPFERQISRVVSRDF